MTHAGIKFLDAYVKEDINIYFGRKSETEELFEKVRKSRITLLYGLSGTGKTSLVLCGLANKFTDSEWIDIVIRRGSDTHILAATREAIQDKTITPFSSKNNELDILRILYLDHFRPIYLIYDQFEELFIYGTNREIASFINFLEEVMKNTDIEVRVILVLREEYVTNLDSFEEKIPNIYNSRLRLERMSSKTLVRVVSSIGEQSNIEINKLVASKIIRNIEDPLNKSVDLPYLQVYLDKLFSTIVRNTDIDKYDLTLSDIKKVGKLNDVLADFLDKRVADIALKVGYPESDIWTLLKQLISSEGTRQGMTLEALEHSLQC